MHTAITVACYEISV